jgi:hypothetical protein
MARPGPLNLEKAVDRSLFHCWSHRRALAWSNTTVLLEPVEAPCTRGFSVEAQTQRNTLYATMAP